MLQNVDIETLKQLYNEPFFSMMFVFFYQHIELNLLEQKETEQIVDQRKAWFEKQQLIPKKEYYSNLITKLYSFDEKKNGNKYQPYLSQFNSEYLSQFHSDNNMMKKLPKICSIWTNKKFQNLENFSRWSNKFIEYPEFTSTNKYDLQAQIDAMDVIRHLLKNQSKMKITTQSLYEIIQESLLQKTNLNQDYLSKTEVQFDLINDFQLDEKNEYDLLNSQESIYEEQLLDKPNQIILPVTQQAKTKKEIQNKFLQIQKQTNR